MGTKWGPDDFKILKYNPTAVKSYTFSLIADFLQEGIMDSRRSEYYGKIRHAEHRFNWIC